MIYPRWSPGQKILRSLFSRARFSAKCATRSLPRKVGKSPLLPPSHRETKALNIPRSSEPEWASHLEGSGLLISPPRDFIIGNISSVPLPAPRGGLGTCRSVRTLEGHWRGIEAPSRICLGPETSPLPALPPVSCFCSVFFSTRLSQEQRNYLFASVKLQ